DPQAPPQRLPLRGLAHDGAEIRAQRLPPDDDERIHDHPGEQQYDRDLATADPPLHCPSARLPVCPSLNSTRSTATLTALPTFAAPCGAYTSNARPAGVVTVKNANPPTKR